MKQQLQRDLRPAALVYTRGGGTRPKTQAQINLFLRDKYIRSTMLKHQVKSEFIK